LTAKTLGRQGTRNLRDVALRSEKDKDNSGVEVMGKKKGLDISS